MLDDAEAFWLRAPGRGEIRPVALPEPGPGDVVVRTLRSGVVVVLLPDAGERYLAGHGNK